MLKRKRWRTDMEIDELLHRSHIRNVETAKTMLRKLSIAELRTLYRHYFKITLSPGEISKRDMVDEIADVYASDEFDHF
jgi:hypothetical protein